jgi:hypothetical protein
MMCLYLFYMWSFVNSLPTQIFKCDLRLYCYFGLFLLFSARSVLYYTGYAYRNNFPKLEPKKGLWGKFLNGFLKPWGFLWRVQIKIETKLVNLVFKQCLKVNFFQLFRKFLDSKNSLFPFIFYVVLILIPRIILVSSLIGDVYYFKEFHYIYLSCPLYVILWLQAYSRNVIELEVEAHIDLWDPYLRAVRTSTGETISLKEYFFEIKYGPINVHDPEERLAYWFIDSFNEKNNLDRTRSTKLLTETVREITTSIQVFFEGPLAICRFDIIFMKINFFFCMLSAISWGYICLVCFLIS